MKEFPKGFKYGRCFRIKLKNEIKSSYINLNVYKYGIKATEKGWISNVQINSILRLIRILLKRKIKMKINISFVIPVTKKPLETRMGSGKGERKFWKCPVRKGMVLFEFGDLNLDEIYKIYRIILNRLEFLVKIVKVKY